MFATFREDGAICYSVLCDTNIFIALKKIRQILNSYSSLPDRNLSNGEVFHNHMTGACDLLHSQGYLTSSQLMVKEEVSAVIPDLSTIEIKMKEPFGPDGVTEKKDNSDNNEMGNTNHKESTHIDDVPRLDVECVENKTVIDSCPIAMPGAAKQEDTWMGNMHVTTDTKAIASTDAIFMENMKACVSIEKGAQKEGNQNGQLAISKKHIYCAKCNLQFPSHKDYSKHYSRVHRVKMCPHCHKVLKGSEEIKRHSERHAGCAMKQREIQRSKLKRDQKEARPLKPLEYVCNICGLKFSQKHALQRHMSKEHNHLEDEHKEAHYLEKTMCNLCGWTTSQARYLRTHMLRKHNQLEDGLRHCEICKMTFKLQKCFEKHMECHKNSNFKCNHCPQTFPDHKSLKKHQLIHRRHYCTKCPAVMKTSHELKVRFYKDPTT